MGKTELKALTIIFGIFAALYFLPVDSARFTAAIFESMKLLRWYAREHVILCLLTAFFIASAIGIFLSQGSVMRYLGAGAKKVVSYGVASISGSVLAVCSCTVLPLFAGIYKMGAGIGPATAFLYSGPAINVLAIILTAKIIGMRIGIARGIGAVVFSVIIGLLMAFIFRNDDERPQIKMQNVDDGEKGTLWKSAATVGSLMLILIFANWGASTEKSGFFHAVYSIKWYLTAGTALLSLVLMHFILRIPIWHFGIGAVITAITAFIPGSNPNLVFLIGLLSLSIILFVDRDRGREWLDSTVGYAIQIMPLLFAGVAVAGFLLGTAGNEGIIPGTWVKSALGGNGLLQTFIASVAGAFMYFATLTEVPIIQGLMENGMGEGPALALLLAGPALSLPNMLVIRSVMGTKKTVVFVCLVIVLSTIAGYGYALIF
ncbi:permease [Myxococcota bacterium]|nr:permease [Myxococcota bacterium]MBU1383187.1 permease [Myxococcota bacterium]MBU1497177.1 permease [Myxococcota bacterium]